MAAADTARLIAELVVDDRKWGPKLNAAIRQTGVLEKKFGRVGGIAEKGIGTAARNLARLGVVAVGGLTVAITTGLRDLATLESAVTSVDGAIKQLGLTGKVTGTQVAEWANQIEKDVGAAFDDKAITSATATLIRFGHVAPANIRPAMVVMTDLATKTGSVDSAASLLAKALADPAKAAGKLARVGVVLTKSEQDQIKAFVKAGKTTQAQKLLLDALAKSTEGAAAASQGPYQRAISILADVSEDARKALAMGFLPVIEKVASLLSTELAKQSTLDNLKAFGTTLAGSLDSLISIAQRLPWSSIGDALKLAGQGSKAVLDAFTAMPAWVQTAVLTGWGLNKLTGGALTGIVGELGKGLIKGVLGMNAGVVNAKAGVVNVSGPVSGLGGAGGAAAPAAGGAPAALAPMGVLTVALAGGTLGELGYVIQEGMRTALTGLTGTLFPTQPQMTSAVDQGLRMNRDIFFPGFDTLNHLDQLPGQIAKLGTAIDGLLHGNKPAPAGGTVHGVPADDPHAENRHKAQMARLAELKSKEAEALVAFRAAERASETGLAEAKSATTRGAALGAAATQMGATRIAAAVAANRPIITTNVKVSVTAATVSKSVTVQERYGSGNGSAGGGHHSGIGGQ